MFEKSMVFEKKEESRILGHANLKNSWVQYQIKQKDGDFAYPPSLLSSYSSGTSIKGSNPSNSSSGINPAVLFAIVVLAVLFFISGLLHLLVRFLIKHPTLSRSNRYPEVSSPDDLQRQLQQLFHLHDSGLDQAFIDALPVFKYKEIVGGAKEPFDCAVCLCEFSMKDKLRLLPTCSHAFHIDCIDTWLLSNSTCPICRATLFSPGFSIENPTFDADSFTEDEECPREKGVLQVRLGKFKKLSDEVGGESSGETSSSNLDARRCFSMGSCQYVVNELELKVPFCLNQPNRDLKASKATERNLKSLLDGDADGKKISNMTKGESFSVSKIWLWSKKGKYSSDAQTGMPSSTNLDLSWTRKIEEI